jgi:outer membrane biosynthesis protein TonB
MWPTIVGLSFIGMIIFAVLSLRGFKMKTGKGKKHLMYAGVLFLVMVVAAALSPDVAEPVSTVQQEEDKKDEQKEKNEEEEKAKKEEEEKLQEQEDAKKKEAEEAEKAAKQKEEEEEEEEADKKAEAEKAKKKQEAVDKSKAEAKEIDTAIFAYAEKVDVTNAIDTTQHVTVFVTMNNEVKPGLAAQHVVNQTYDFLQQSDLTGAKTVTIAVKQSDTKIMQFTVNKDSFVPIDDVPMSECVMKASKIDSMTPEVEEFGVVMESW